MTPSQTMDQTKGAQTKIPFRHAMEISGEDGGGICTIQWSDETYRSVLGVVLSQWSTTMRPEKSPQLSLFLRPNTRVARASTWPSFEGSGGHSSLFNVHMLSAWGLGGGWWAVGCGLWVVAKEIASARESAAPWRRRASPKQQHVMIISKANKWL
jgi:hypothetical protein